MNNVLLGAIDQASGSPVYGGSPTSGGIVYDPTSGGGVLDIDKPSTGSMPPTPPTDISFPRDPDSPVPNDVNTDEPVGPGTAEIERQRLLKDKQRKTMIAVGIGGLVLAYLLFRKK
jgi:hypothetical protein